MKQAKIYNLPMMKTQAEEKVAILNKKFGGKTYMNLEFTCCPAYGSFDIYVNGKAESKEELLEMTMALLVSEVIR